MEDQYEEKSKDSDQWASKANSYQERIQEMENDLSVKAGEIKQVFKDKETDIAKWREKFDMNERLISSMKEAEQRLKNVQEIELTN